MFREMRRKDRELGPEETNHILCSENYGVLSVNGDDGYPYGVPVNYAFAEGTFYIHATSQKSHKLDAIRKNPKVCLTVIAQHDLVPEELSTNYASAIVFGTARIVEDPQEKTEALRMMMDGLAPEMAETALEQYKDVMSVLAMIEIVPEHVSGKARR